MTSGSVDPVVAPRLTPGDIRLRPWNPSEAAWYVGALDDEILRWTLESPAMDPEACAEALSAAAGADRERALAIVEIEEGALLGNLTISRHGAESELSYWVAAEARGRGAATAALITGTRLALRDPGVGACFLRIHPDNTASIRVAERAGYRYAGTQPGPADCSNDAGLVAVYRYDSTPGSAEGAATP